MNKQRELESWKKNSISFGSVVFLLFYQLLCSIYISLTPLLGLFLAYLIIHLDEALKHRKNLEFSWYLAMIYFMYASFNKGFYLISGVVFFGIYYFVFAEWIYTNLKFKNVIFTIYACSAYIGLFAINNLFVYILEGDYYVFGIEYLIYSVIDTILVLIIFRDKSL